MGKDCEQISLLKICPENSPQCSRKYLYIGERNSWKMSATVSQMLIFDRPPATKVGGLADWGWSEIATHCQPTPQYTQHNQLAPLNTNEVENILLPMCVMWYAHDAVMLATCYLLLVSLITAIDQVCVVHVTAWCMVEGLSLPFIVCLSPFLSRKPHLICVSWSRRGRRFFTHVCVD